ncbi:MAG: hypothetical protein RI861_07500, partial [Planktomarina sp.]|nr:hypothetical protein [Planktomarina sp.]MDS9947398.1 hypothetical protein [Planktomarina sp.]|tara:strand:+ start:5818 stop:6078 length:261 start_codon:yes stop_codon:yes gene_type:complete
MAIESYCYIEGNKMFRQLFKAIVVARQASVSASAMRYISDCQFKELGYERSNYVEKVKLQLIAELDAKDILKENEVPINSNLVGFV